MRFALISIVSIEGVDFTSMLIYTTDERGISNCVGEILKPFDNDLIDDIHAYDLEEIQTDSKELYRLFVAEQLPVLYRYEIIDTHKVAEFQRDLVIDLYELDIKENEPLTIAKWRLYLIKILEKIITKLKETN